MGVGPFMEFIGGGESWGVFAVSRLVFDGLLNGLLFVERPSAGGIRAFVSEEKINGSRAKRR